VRALWAERFCGSFCPGGVKIPGGRQSCCLRRAEVTKWDWGAEVCRV